MRKLLRFIVGFAFLIASLSCQNIAQVGNSQAGASSSPTTKLHFPQPCLDEREELYFIEQIESGKFPTHQPSSSSVHCLMATTSTRMKSTRTWESGSRFRTKPRFVFHKGTGESSGEIV
jgi:hypothetical protein